MMTLAQWLVSRTPRGYWGGPPTETERQAWVDACALVTSVGDAVWDAPAYRQGSRLFRDYVASARSATRRYEEDPALAAAPAPTETLWGTPVKFTSPDPPLGRQGRMSIQEDEDEDEDD